MIKWEIAALLLTCSACITLNRSNPYDPKTEAANKAKGRLVGQIAFEETRADLTVRIAAIAVRSGDDAGRRVETQADPDGKFVLELDADAYNLEVMADGFQVMGVSNLTVGPGERLDAGLLALRLARGAMRGGVRFLTPARDSSPAANVGVLLVREGGGSASLFTGPDGQFQARDLPVGRYTIFATYQDYATAASADYLVITERETLDASPLTLYPRSAIIKLLGSAGLKYSRDRAITVELFAFLDKLKEMKVSLDPSFSDPLLGDVEYREYAAQVPFSLADGDGKQTVYAKFKDGLDRESEVFFAEIVLDREAPTVEALRINNGDAYVRSLAVQLQSDGKDLLSGIAGYRMVLDGDITTAPLQTAESRSESVTLRLPLVFTTQGTHVVQWVFVDRAGNESTVATASVFADTIPPVVGTPVMTILEQNGFVNSLGVFLSFNVTPDRPGEQLLVALSNEPGISDNAPRKPIEATLFHTLKPGPDDVRTVYARFWDDAGNPTTQEYAATTKLKTDGPALAQLKIEPHFGRDGYTSYALVDLKLSAQGAIEMRISSSYDFDSVDTTPWIPLALTYPDLETFTDWELPDGDGWQYVYAEFVDVVGNVSEVAWAEIYVDTIAPPAPLLNPPVPLADGASLSWSDAGDDVSHYEIHFSPFGPNDYYLTDMGVCDPNQPPEKNIEIHNLPFSRTIGFQVVAVDCAGNPSAPSNQLSVLTGLSSNSVTDTPDAELTLFADDPYLWRYFKNGTYFTAERCDAGGRDCKESGSWNRTQVNFQAPISSVTMFADDKHIFMSAVVRPTNPPSEDRLMLAVCSKFADCSVAGSWTLASPGIGAGRLRDAGQNDRKGFTVTGFSSLVSGSTGAFMLIAYRRETPVGGFLSIARCSHTSDSACSELADWTNLDFFLPISDAHPLSLFTNETENIIGFVTRGGLRWLGEGQAGWARCRNDCLNDVAYFDPDYQRGDLAYNVLDQCAFSDFSPTYSTSYDLDSNELGEDAINDCVDATDDSTTPVFTSFGSELVGLWRNYNGVQENVLIRKCTAPAGCYVSTNFRSFTDAIFTAADKGPTRPLVALARTANLPGANVELRAYFPDSVPRQLRTRTCIYRNADSCDVSGEWSDEDVLSSGPWSVAPISTASVGPNLFLATPNSLGQGRVLAPMSPAAHHFFASPLLGAVEVHWTPRAGSYGVQVTHQSRGDDAGTLPYQQRVLLGNPNADAISITATDEREVGIRSYGFTGFSDYAAACIARPFTSDIMLRDDATVNGAAINPIAIATSASSTEIYAVIGREDEADDDDDEEGVWYGRCDPTLAACENPNEWTWLNVDPYKTEHVQLAVDVPRNWNDGSPIAARLPRVVSGGLQQVSGNALYFDMCDPNVPSSFCANSEWLDDDGGTSIFLAGGTGPTGPTGAAPRFDLTGNTTLAVWEDSFGVNARYCDGWLQRQTDWELWTDPIYGDFEQPDGHCLYSSNWSFGSNENDSTPILAGASTSLAAHAHPTFGLMVARGRGGYVELATCPYGKGLDMNTVVIPRDCGDSNEWTSSFLPASAPAALDMTSSGAFFRALPGNNALSDGMFMSYYDNGWWVATCRAEINPSGGTWGCNNARGYSQVRVASAIQPGISSTIRVIGGNLVMAFFEPLRMGVAVCPGGRDCDRASKWRVFAAESSFRIKAGLFAGGSLLAADPIDKGMLLAYPNNPNDNTSELHLLLGGLMGQNQ